MLTVGPHQLQASYPGDNSFASSQGSYNFTVSKADSAIVDFFPIGNPVVNVPVQLAGQIALTNNWCGPYGGTMTVTDLTGPAPVVLTPVPVAVSAQYCDSYSVPVTFTTPGTHVLKLSFSGDSNVSPTTSGLYYLPVTSSAASSTILSADLPTAMAGRPVTLARPLVGCYFGVCFVRTATAIRKAVTNQDRTACAQSGRGGRLGYGMRYRHLWQSKPVERRHRQW